MDCTLEHRARMIVKDPYRPPILHFIRHTAGLYRDPPTTFLRWRHMYGETFVIPVIRPPVHHIHNPADIKHVLVTHQRRYRKGGGLAVGRLLLGQGLLSSEDLLHARQRRTVQPSLNRTRVAVLPDMIVRKVDHHLHSWVGKPEIDIAQEMTVLSLAVVGQAMFSHDFYGVARQLIAAFLQCQRHIQPRSFILFTRSWPTPNRRRYLAAIRTIDTIIHAMIRERRAASDKPEDLLTALLTTSFEDGSTMSDQQIRDELVTIILAGHETTANALAWTWYLLLQNPDHQDTLRAEIDTVLGQRLPTAGDIPLLSCAEMVFLEAMRLFPPAWILARRAIEDDVLESGVRIAAGQDVLMMPFVVHRDERWYPDPQRFDPGRFTPAQRSARPAFAYFPFGGGGRGCMGEAFAILEAVVILSMVTQRFRMSLVPGQTIAPEALLTLRPRHGIRVQLRPR